MNKDMYDGCMKSLIVLAAFIFVFTLCVGFLIGICL